MYTVYGAPAYTGTYFTSPVFGTYYYYDSTPYRTGYNSYYYSPGPPNYYPDRSDFYGSPRYWNWYYPGY
jgi:hypothetical protein